MTVAVCVCGCKSRGVTGDAIYQYANVAIYADSIVAGSDVIKPPSTSPYKNGVRINSGSQLVDRLCEAELFDMSNGFTTIVPLRRVTDATLLIMPHRCDSDVTHASTPREFVALDRLASAGVDVDISALLSGARALADSLYRRQLSHEEGIYCGIPDDYPAAALPPWTDTADRRHIMTAEYNIDCYRLLKVIERLAPSDKTLMRHTPDMLAHSIKQSLWLPNLNGLSPYLYCFPYAIQLNAVDNRSTSLAVIEEIMSPQMSMSAIAGSPVTEADVPFIYPEPAGCTDPKRAGTLALRAIASSRVNNANSFNHAAGLLMQTLCSSRAPAGYTPMLDMVLSGIAGIKLQPNSLSIRPCKPEWLDRDLVISGLQYRKATFDLTIKGVGSIVSTCAIDRNISTDNALPDTLTGHHTVTVTVTLSGMTGHGDIHITHPATMPAPSQLSLGAQNSVDITTQGDVTGTMLYINGALIEELNTDRYEPPHFKVPTWICAVPVRENDICGMTGKPLMFVDKSQCIIIGAGKAGETGSKLLSDKKTVRRRRHTVTQLIPSKYERGVVESTLFHNATLTFKANIKTAGRYLVDIEYLDGLGIVNPERKLTERQLKVDGKEAGTFICPQLHPDKWSPDIDWRDMTGWSNMLAVNLRAGNVELTLTPVADTDGDDSLLLIKSLRLIKL